jgi:tryptophan synthase beta chain
VATPGLPGSILVHLPGRGDKDLDFVVEKYGYGPEFLAKMEEKRKQK